MSVQPGFGNSCTNSVLQMILNDLLADQGTALTIEQGSLAWCECFVIARAMMAAQQFVTLLANQLTPANMSVLSQRYAQMFAVANTPQLPTYLQENQSLFGQVPNYSNVFGFLQEVLGQIFLNIIFLPVLQPQATTNPASQLANGGSYISPMSRILVYEWQPRDNQDNLLMTNAVFQTSKENYHQILDKWLPAYTHTQSLNLLNRGFEDGYGNGYNGLNFNNYIDGYNVVTGTTGSAILTGTNTAFFLYPNGQTGDFQLSLNAGYQPPIQIMDDNNAVQTYYVASVQSNTQLTLTTPLVSNITNRTYRCLGFVLDVANLDGTAFFSG